MLKSLILSVLALLPCGVLQAQYNLRTDTAVIPYPSPVPTPPAAKGGSATIEPTNFPGVTVIRLTDSTGWSGVTGSQWSVSATALGINWMNYTKTRIILNTSGHVVVVGWNDSTYTPSQIYSSGYLSKGTDFQFVYGTESPPANANLAYHLDSEAGTNNPIINQYDFTSSTTAPTVANGGITKIFDLSTCDSSLAGKGTELGPAGTAFFISHDSSTSGGPSRFWATLLNGTCTAGSYPSCTGGAKVWLSVGWDRTLGGGVTACRVWNLATANVGPPTSAWGPVGATSDPAKFTPHFTYVSANGQYTNQVLQTCISNCDSYWSQYNWDAPTVNVYPQSNTVNGCSHESLGYFEYFNMCGDVNIYPRLAIWLRRIDNPGSLGTWLNQANAQAVCPDPKDPNCWVHTDQHSYWNNAVPADNTPVGVIAYRSGVAGAFTPLYGYQNELFIQSTDGSGTTWRLMHSYSSNSNYNWVPFGSLDQSATRFIWQTDWNGGNGPGGCTVGSNCRTDLYMAIVPLSNTLAINTPGNLPDGIVGNAYSYTLSASGGTPPYTWSIASGALPPGLSLGSSTGIIGGTPTTPGTYNFTIRVTDSLSNTVTKPISMDVKQLLIITSDSLPDGIVNNPYSFTLTAAGGTLPYTWSIDSGSLPLGLSLDSTGVISGTPILVGTTNFTVRVTDSLAVTVTKPLSLTIGAGGGSLGCGTLVIGGTTKIH